MNINSLTRCQQSDPLNRVTRFDRGQGNQLGSRNHSHISLSLLLEDYNMFQDALADLEYKILLTNFTSESDTDYIFAEIGAAGGVFADTATGLDVTNITELMKRNALIAAGVDQELDNIIELGDSEVTVVALLRVV